MEEIIMDEADIRIRVDIPRIIRSLKKRDATIFCRVSDPRQTGNMHISFEMQEQKGNICAGMFNLKVKCILKVVESAYDGKSCTLKTLITKNRGKNIIIYNVSRFCRNKRAGLQLLDYALQYKTRLFFVEEGIVWDANNRNNLPTLRRKLYLAEEESKALGRRVRDALQEKKRRGFFTGGTPKYGFGTVQHPGGKKLVSDVYEQNVITFINMCKTVGTTVRQLNEQMSQISKQFDQPITLYNNDILVEVLSEGLTYENIAGLLNSYGVMKRTGNWTANNVGPVCRVDYNNVLEDLGNMNMDTGF